MENPQQVIKSPFLVELNLLGVNKVVVSSEREIEVWYWPNGYFVYSVIPPIVETFPVISRAGEQLELFDDNSDVTHTFKDGWWVS